MVSIFCFENCGKTYKFFALWFYLSWVIIVLCGRFVAGSGECTLHNPGSGSGHERDDKYLKILDPLKGQRFTVKGENYTYILGICTDVGDETHHNVGILQVENKGQNYSLGSIGDVEVKGGTDWIFLTYNNGSAYANHCNKTNRTSHIMVVCDPSVMKGELQILEERLYENSSHCFYLFELGSSVACTAKKTAHSLSSGSVFCIIAFTVAGIYLLLGFLYQRIVVGAKGLEQIPNYTFWRSFGNLQADGCDYICRCGPRQESQAYRGIDDRIRTDEERDDQLLNM